MTTAIKDKKTIRISYADYPLINPSERIKIWQSVRGMWKNRKPDPIKELAKMRKEWERKLPKLH